LAQEDPVPILTIVASAAKQSLGHGILCVNTKQYYVYIMTNIHHTVLYTGMTNDLRRRAYEHKMGQGGTFTSKYKIVKLVYYEYGGDVLAAIAREKQIKAGSRQDKIDLINQLNPEWKDLFESLFA